MQRNQTSKYVWLVAILALILGNAIVWMLLGSKPDGKFQVYFYDVGQGDSALISTPGGYHVLVDGGPNNKISDYLNRDLPLNDRSLDLVILTHPHSDHMDGLVKVLKDFEVKRVITSNVSNTTSQYKLWIDTVSNQGLNLNYAIAGQTLTLDNNITLKFNWPETGEFQTETDLNIASVVFTLSYNDLDILMTGDADSQVQPYEGDFSSIEVLKVPHHGSRTALKDDFLSQINPKVSIISVAASNRYGHPSSDLLRQLKNVGTTVLRTDESGTIKIVSDGKKWYTQTEN